MTGSVEEGAVRGDLDRDIKDLAGGALINLVGKLGRLSRGAFIWVISLLCGLEVQGLYSLSWGIVSTLNKIARFGLQRGVVRFIVLARSSGDGPGGIQERQVLAGAVGIGLCSSVLLLICLQPAATWLADFYQQPIAAALRVMAFSAPFVTATGIFLAATRALRIMRFDVYVKSIVGPLILLVGGLLVGLAGWGIEGLAWVQFAMSMGCCLLAAYYFRRFFPLAACWPQSGLVQWKELGRFSLPVMLTDLLYSVLTQLDVLMLGWFVSAKMVGIYALARRIASTMLKAPQAFDPIFSSVVSELSQRPDQGELKHRFVVISRWVITINLPIFAGILLVGADLLPAFTNADELALSDLEAGFAILLVLSVGMMVQGIFAIVEPLLAMSGTPYLNLYNNSFWLAANFTLNIWLIESYGIVGAAIGATLSMVAVNIVRIVEIYLLHRIQPFQRSQLKPVIAIAGAVLLGWWVRQLVEPGTLQAFVLPLGFFGGAYIFLLWIFGLEHEDRMLLQRLGRRLGRRI